MKKLAIYWLSLCSVLIIGTTSCKKYLDREPLSDNTQRDFYSNAEQIQLALTGVYSAIGFRTISPGYSNPTSYYAKFDLFTEIGIERNLSNTIGSGAYDATNGTVAEVWGGFYQVIQRANNMLFYMPKAKDVMPAADYNRAVAEAKVLRAMAYWHLITFYGDVPFFTTPPLSNDQLFSFTRTSKTVIIDFLLADLEAASADLSWDPAQGGRVSKGVAFGVQARLAMLERRYPYVAEVTDKIINNSGYGLNPVYQNLFRKAGQATNANKEIMFYYPFGDADLGSFNYLQLVQGSRNQGGQSSHFPSQFLVDLFECTDGRTIAESPLYNPALPNRNRDPRMAQTVIVPGDTVIVQGFTSMVFNFKDRVMATYNPTTRVITFPSTVVNNDSASIFGPRANGLGNLWRKYVQDRDINGNAGNLYRTGWVYMRYAEILLLNAEAKFEKNDGIATVAPTLNRIRARAGMPNVSASDIANPTRFRQLIRREKTVEFANEGIHIADLRRWDNGAYAQKVMPLQLYGEANSSMKLTPGIGLEFIVPAPAPTFDATYNVPTFWPSGDALRLKRELRVFNANQHILCPIPQGERDKIPTLTQNPNW